MSAKLTIEDLQIGLQRAVDEGSVMMIFGHKPLNGNTQNANEYGFDIHFLAQILSESAKLRLKYYRMDELFGER